jgi:hypothetical protein
MGVAFLFDNKVAPCLRLADALGLYAYRHGAMLINSPPAEGCSDRCGGADFGAQGVITAPQC